jgi:ABC-type branched-subunit amino acid transport system permease subunit
LAVIAVSYAIEHSRLGYYLTAFRENEDAARALGVRTGQVRLIAMALSSFLSAIIGTFYAQYVVFIDPTSVMRIQVSVQVALFAIVGGIGTALGPAIGAIIFVPITICFVQKWEPLAGPPCDHYGSFLSLSFIYAPGTSAKLKERIPMLEDLKGRCFARKFAISVSGLAKRGSQPY